MNKELKIIESYYPPTNINAIWYDRRINKLKKVVNHQWIEIGEAPVKLPDMPGDDEIWLIGGDPGSSIMGTENLEGWISTTIKRRESSYDQEGREIIKIFLEKGDGENVKIMLDDTAYDVEEVYLPLNLTIIQYGQVHVYDGGKAIYLNRNVTSIENGAIYGEQTGYMSIYCTTEYPPILDLRGIATDYAGSSDITVIVPKSYVDTYKSATNWSEFNINPYNE